MLQESVRKKAAIFIILGVAGTNLLISPWLNLDSIHPVKFITLATSSFLAFGLMLPSISRYEIEFRRPALIAWLVFVVTLCGSNLLSQGSAYQKFLGVQGRNTGVVTYISLALLFFCFIFIARREILFLFVKALMICGAINLVYSIAQYLRIDPIEWSNPFNPIVGTLGNPNFASAFLGICAVVSMSLVLDSSLHKMLRVTLLVFSMACVLLSFLSESIQGVIGSLVGFAFVTYIFLLKSEIHWRFSVAYLSIIVLVGLVSVMGILQRGPLSGLLYQNTVTYRGDYWRASIELLKDYPISGVGMDSFGDYYPFYRSSEAVERRGAGVTTNTVHNVFLDLAVGGGLPLLVAYLIVLIVTLICALRILAHTKMFNGTLVGIMGALIVYLAQSFVSINQIGLAVWGWSAMGLIIGLDYNRNETGDPLRHKGIGLKANSLPARNLVSATCLAMFGIVLSYLPITQDAKAVSLFRAGNPVAIQKFLTENNVSNYYTIQGAILFERNNLSSSALELYEIATLRNPRDLEGWAGVYRLAEGNERELALERMKELDPQNRKLWDIP